MTHRAIRVAVPAASLLMLAAFTGPAQATIHPIIQSVTDDAARQRLIATYDHNLSVPEFSMGYHWDIVLDGPQATWMEEGR